MAETVGTPSPETVMLVALYLRVSTEEQAKHGHSLPEQRSACLKKASELAEAEERRTGARVHLQTVEFTDTVGGDILERPELENARAFVRENRPTFFVCLDPDRFSRATYQAMLVANEIETAGTRLEFVQHDYQTTPEGQLFFTLRLAIAQYEKAKILERTARGRRGKIRSGGLPTGLHMFGYTYNKETEEVTPDPVEAPWVEQIFRWAHSGLGCQLIANRLNEAGVRTKRDTMRWYRATITKILTNRGYIGELQVNRYDTSGLGPQRNLPRGRRTKLLTPKQRPKTEWVTIPIPPLIPRQLWDEVQERRGPAQARRAQQSVNLLSGLLNCGLCGGPLHYLPRPQGALLRCANRYPACRDMKAPPPRCSMPHIRALPVETEVWERICAVLVDPKVILAYNEARRAPGAEDSRRAALVQEQELLERQLAEKQKEQGRILAVVATGAVDPEVAAAQLMPCKEQMAALRAALERLQRQLAKLEQAEESSKRKVDRIRAARTNLGTESREGIQGSLALLNQANRRELVRMLIGEVTAYPRGPCHIEFLA